MATQTPTKLIVQLGEEINFRPISTIPDVRNLLFLEITTVKGIRNGELYTEKVTGVLKQVHNHKTQTGKSFSAIDRKTLLEKVCRALKKEYMSL